MKSSLNHEKNWAWCHSGGRHAHIIENPALILKFVSSLPEQNFFKFQNFIHLPLFRAFYRSM